MPRKLSALVAIVFVAALLIPAAQAIAAPATVTGTLTIREKVTLSPNAVAVFSIVGQQANSNAGSIVGYQRINNAKTPVEFSVPYDTTAIDQKQSYAIFGSIIDGSTVYQTFEPVPVITGGPTTGVTLVATDKPPADAGAVTGTIVMPAKAAKLSSSAVAVAALVEFDHRDDGRATGDPDAWDLADRVLDRGRRRGPRSRPIPTSRRRVSSMAGSSGPASTAYQRSPMASRSPGSRSR